MIKFGYNKKRYEHGKPYKNSNSSLGSFSKLRYLAGLGIVTVTLVNQAPQPVTHTISKVVEKLVPKRSPGQGKDGGFFQRRKSRENNKRRVFGGS